MVPGGGRAVGGGPLMKAQVSVELLVISAGLLAVYSLVMPSLFSSFEKTSASFNSQLQNSIIQNIEWKASEVELLEEGAVLYADVTSPFEFNFSTRGSLVNVAKGKNSFELIRTSQGVEIQSK